MKKRITRFLIINLADCGNRYSLEALIREFLRPEEYFIIEDTTTNREAVINDAKQEAEANECELVYLTLPEKMKDKDEAKRYVYDRLSELTEYKPEWGTLTGVRPTKQLNEMMIAGADEKTARRTFQEKYYVNQDKIDLLFDTCENQAFITGKDAGRSVGVYIGIPFCPTRCLYCSFTSNQADENAMRLYLDALLKEIEVVAGRLVQLDVKPESIYIGGGTPTSLNSSMLYELLKKITSSFDMDDVIEFCTEAGRPDTITAEKFAVLHDFGVNRVSINPQSMNERTLQIIGRSHSVDDIYKAFEIAKKSGIRYINTDIIAGLPEENQEMFKYTMENVVALDPDNITIHTLAVKRASRLKTVDADYNYDKADGVGKMVADARIFMNESGYRPYYMYRQKHMTGNHENVSYCKPGSESVYNIRIMDEHQTIVALGAGGISKAYFPDENRLERIPNVSNYEIYIQRIDEMIKRKEDKLYLPFI